MNLNKKMIIKTAKLATILGGSASMMACTVLASQTQKTIATANNAVDQAESQLNNSKDLNIASKKYIKYSDAPYFGASAIKSRSNEDLPVVFQQSVKVDQTFNDLNQVASVIQKITHIPVYVDSAGQTGGGGGNQIQAIRITQQDGTLEELLDLISSKTDTSWQYKNGQILLSQTETRTFVLKNLPGSIKVSNASTNSSGMDSSTSGAGGGSTSGGSSSSGSMQQNVNFDLQGDAWGKYEDGVKSLLSSVGKYSANANNQSITITDKPSIMLKVADYIDKQNSLIDKQVQIDVQVIAVDTQADDNYGINWNLVFKSAQGGFSINGQAAGGAATGSSTASPIFIPSMGTQAFTFTPGAGSSMAGSSMVINALSSILRTSEVTNTAALTSSSQPVPINFTQQIGYLASVQTTVSGTSGAGAYQTSLTPGTLSVGFSMNILPIVEGKDNIRMQIAVSISNLKAMNTFSSGGAQGSTIQLPTVNNRTFMQKVKLKSGSTFILTGFDDSLDKIFQQGVGNASWWLFGGGYTAGKTKTRMIMLVTPHLVEG